MESNNNSKNKFINKNNGGFTLVELLATLAIISLVSVIVIYTATNVINNARDKSYLVTINNIQKESGTYVLENDKNIVWLNDGGNYLYQCVTVQNLIDMGYFSNDILDSKVSDDRNVLANDYIYIEKDKDSKTITKQVLLYDNNSDLRRLCGDYVNVQGNVLVDVPSGWATSKDIVITYILDSSIGDSTNYKYDYMYDAFNNNSLDIPYESFRFTTIRTVSKKITVHDEGSVYANIKKQDGEIIFPINVEVDKIDTLEPEITESVSDQTVRGSVIIPINISDSESGVDVSSISLSDFKVYIGGNELTSGVKLDKGSNGNYNISINDRYYAGDVVIEIESNQILDNVGNGNKKIVLSTGVVFDNTYTITYYANGGKGSMSSTICTYGVNCTLRDNTFTRTGCTFLGWSTDKNATSAMYDDEYKFEPFKLKDDMTLYAVWRINKVYINYSKKDGNVTTMTKEGSTTYNWTVDSNGIILKDDKAPFYSIEYGKKLGDNGLADYNNSNYLNITRTGFSGKSGAEWKCLSGCTTSGKTYSHSTVYSADDFCDAKTSDCTVVLGVNWIDSQKPTPPVISLNSSGNLTFGGSSDNVTSSANLIYKASLSNGDFSISFSTPSNTSNIYAVSVDEAGNVSDVSSKKYVVDNVQNGSVKKETVVTGYKCSLDNKVYSTQSEANNACVTSDTKSPDSTTKYYCKEGYTGNGSKCVKTGNVTKQYYCSNTKKYQEESICASKLDQSSCPTGYTQTKSSNCSFTCSYGNVLLYSACSGVTKCSGGTKSCVGVCTNPNDPYCRGGVTLSGDRCSSLSQLYNCTLYGSLSYYCDLTGGYVSSSKECVDIVNYSSYKEYSCPSGYSTKDSKVTKDSICTKTVTGTVTDVTKTYYSCSLFSGTEYITEASAKTACTNYCSNASTKYYSGKNKCIGLS